MLGSFSALHPEFSILCYFCPMPVILAIESSCDETSAAICDNGKILSNNIATQAVHAQYGGVIPELASRAHLQNIVPVVDVALNKAGKTLSDVDAFAFTQAPGLIGSPGGRRIRQIAGHVVRQAVDQRQPYASPCAGQPDT